VHSSTDCLKALQSIQPQQLFIEASKDILNLVRRNHNHSPKLRDLPVLVKYADMSEIPIHAIDTTATDVSSRIFGDLSTPCKRSIWSYAMKKRLCTPFANMAFEYVLNRNRISPLFDRLATRWSVSPEMLENCRNILTNGGSMDDVEAYIESSNDITTFVSSPASDPLAYIQLCDETGIDRILQSVIIDYRNAYMSNQLRRILRTIEPESTCAVVVGKNHIQGMFDNLSNNSDCIPDPPRRAVSMMDQILLASLVHCFRYSRKHIQYKKPCSALIE